MASLKTSLGSYGYSGQYGQNPAPEGGGILKRSWFNVISWQDFNKKLEEHKVTQDKLAWNYTIDTAYTAEEDNDYSSILSYVFIGADLFIRDSTSVRLEFPELIKFIPQHVAKNGGNTRSRIRIEPKASGLSVYQTLKRNTGLNVIKGKPPVDD